MFSNFPVSRFQLHFLTITISLIVLFINGCSSISAFRDSFNSSHGRSQFTWHDELTSSSSASRISPEAQEVLQRDLVVGMDMEHVRTFWGEPRNVEVAGDPRLGNQRWLYSDSISSRWNLTPARVVYFESGRVVGWETRMQ